MPARIAPAAARADQSPFPEKMHRPREIFQQKPDGEDIEHHAERAAQTVVRSTAHPLRIADGHLGHARAVERRQRGNKTMQLPVQIHVLQNFGAVRFKGGSEIAQIHVGGLRHQPVGDARGNLARDRVIQPVFAPAAGDIVAFLDFFKQRRDVLGRVLKIAVERDDHLALRLVKSGGERRRLPEIPAQPDHFETRVGLDQVRQQIEAAVYGRVVDEDDLVRLVDSLEDRRQAVIQRKNRRLLIMNRNDDGKIHAARLYQGSLYFPGFLS